MSYYDEELVRQLTAEAIDRSGSRLLQMHRFGDSDQAHARSLLSIFRPPKGARIADIGCGVGELASLMQAERPDLSFVLVNTSPAQLQMCPDHFTKILADAESLPLERGDVDALMVTYALGHFDLPRFAQGAMRILAPGQELYVFDLFKDSTECRLSEDLNYAELSTQDVIDTLEQHRFTLTSRLTTTTLPPATASLLPRPDTLGGCTSRALVFKRT